MSDNVVPITPGVTPEMDGERELVEWFTNRLRAFHDEHGRVPQSAVAVLLHESDEELRHGLHSWSPGERHGMLTARSLAVTLLNRSMA